MSGPPDSLGPPEIRRHSVSQDSEYIQDPLARAQREAENGLRQFDVGLALIEDAIAKGPPFRLRPSHILQLRARGVVRKPERTAVRKIQERHAAGRGPAANVRRAAYLEAAKAAFQDDLSPRAWEFQAFRRQQLAKRLYLEEAKALGDSVDPQDRALAVQVADFVRSMPAPASQRLELARELRGARHEELKPHQRDGVDRER